MGAVLLTGLLGGVHCAGMCGGIVAALSGQVPAGTRQWPLHLSYNLGRITSYAVAGAAAGAIGTLGLLLDGMLPVQLALYVLANLLLIALGLYLAYQFILTSQVHEIERTAAVAPARAAAANGQP